jgi:O-antigen/teichoic acid export membrane protein
LSRRRLSVSEGITRGSVILGLEQVVSGGLGVIFLLLFVRQVGSTDFGLWSIAYAAASLAAIATTRLHLTLERFLPEYLEQGDGVRARWLAHHVLIAKLGLGMLAAGALAAVAPLIAASFDRPELTPIIRVLALWLVADSMANFGRSLLLGLQEFPTRLACTSLQGLVNVATALAALAANGGVIFISWGFVASTVVAGVPQVVLGYRLLLAETKGQRVTVRLADEPSPWSRVLRYGLPLSASGALFQLYLSLAKLLLGYMVGPQGTGVFSFASGILEKVTGLSGSATSAFLPSFSRLMARSDLASLRRYSLPVFRISALMAALTTVFLFTFAREVTLGLGGDEFAEAAIVLQILSFQAMLRIPALSLSTLLYALEATFTGLLISTAKLAAEFVLYVALIPVMAERGAALAQVLSYGLALVALWCVLRGRVGLGAGDYGLSLLWVSLLAAPILAMAVLVDQHVASHMVGLLVKASLACAVVVIYAAPIVFRVGLSPRSVGTDGLKGWPFGSLKALDAEGEAR